VSDAVEVVDVGALLLALGVFEVSGGDKTLEPGATVRFCCFWE
jgi:hypothetical protein